MCTAKAVCSHIYLHMHVMQVFFSSNLFDDQRVITDDHEQQHGCAIMMIISSTARHVIIMIAQHDHGDQHVITAVIMLYDHDDHVLCR